MSEVDPSIILQAKPVQFANPMELASNAMQLRNLGLQGQNQQITLEQNQRALKDQKTIADLYRANVDPATGAVNHAGIEQGLAQAGLGDKIPAYQQQVATAAKDATGAETAQYELQQKKLADIGNRLASLVSKPDLSRQDVIDQANQLTNQHSLTPEQRDQMLQRIPQDPKQLKDFLVRSGMQNLAYQQQVTTRLAQAPKYNEQDTGAVINQGTVDPLTGVRTPGATNVAKTMTPDQAAKVKLIQDRGTFTGDAGDLLASLAAKGVSLPAGMRSKEQQISTLNGLMRKYPNMSPDEIADNIATGQIGFGAAKKEITVAAAQAGRVSIAANELETFGSQVLDASKDLPRGSSMTINGLMQLGEKEISDPQLLRLRVKLQALNSAYDQLAARGGTDADKRAHIHELFNVRLSDAGIHTLVQALNEESDGAKAAAAKAQEYHPPANAPAGRTPDSSTPPDIAALLKKHGGK